VDAVRVVGHGPWVPATPLVTPADGPVPAAALRDAVRAAVADPALAVAREALGIERFVPLGSEVYGVIDGIVALAERALPRAGTHRLAG